MVAMIVRTGRVRVAVFVSDAVLVGMPVHFDTILRAHCCAGQDKGRD